MENNKIQQIINDNREFMKYYPEKDEDYISDQEKKLPQPPLCDTSDKENLIDLTKDFSQINFNNNLLEVLDKRKSSRVYTNKDINVDQLSYILYYTQYVKEIKGQNYATIRYVPSGGARHPFETYILINNVIGLKPGLYHYLALSHQLEFIKEVDNIPQVFNDSLCGQPFVKKANFVLYYTCNIYRCEWRYGISAHRVALIDTGHLGQNVYLCCSSLDLGTCGIAAFDHYYCNRLLDIDGEKEYVVYTFTVGTI
ncbi:MAG: SagB/ThcOx family dehydrogenase [Erysipelotrichaceae bacterium]